jgi:hypothetical protein
MGNKFSVAIIGGLLCASQALAGTAGNGWDQRNGTAPVAKTHYSYCFGGARGPRTAYFSSVITSAPTVNKPDLNGPFGKYLTKTIGSNDGGQCFSSEAMADAVSGKKQREALLVEEKWKIVETQWAGVGAH